ncbi:hypothetical protein JDV02_002452 [Purpureocillium takamizusanense]|uniref:Uncharacterized protein n=1 Tax=Purpureocillium takamizusanense TaxID=2060973 RepID=A0A9Q8QB07_9HYPO|nr:uncharacterized protein JDV02_002452 [Purpureocillium takamizusanense]UNI15972.1 hypothetical protein JDV02_002452 [Purpureocillium takamizusanense]
MEPLPVPTSHGGELHNALHEADGLQQDVAVEALAACVITPRYTIAHVRLEREQPRHRRIPARFRCYVPSPLVQCWSQDSVPTPPPSEHNSSCSSPSRHDDNDDETSIAARHNSPSGHGLESPHVFQYSQLVVEEDSSDETGGWPLGEEGVNGAMSEGEMMMPQGGAGELTMRPDADYATIFHELSLAELKHKQRRQLHDHHQFHHHHHIQQPVPQHTQRRPTILQPPIGSGRPEVVAADIARPLGPVPCLRTPTNGWPEYPPSEPLQQLDQCGPRIEQEQVYGLPPWHGALNERIIDAELIGFGAGLGLRVAPYAEGSAMQRTNEEGEN